MTTKRTFYLVIIFLSIGTLVSCDGCKDDDPDPCTLPENRKEIREDGLLTFPTGSASLWTPDADKNCHAYMSLNIIYPQIRRVYKSGGEEFTSPHENIDITDYINYEFGVPFGYFPSDHDVGVTRDTERMIFSSIVDQAARNFPFESTQYRVEFNIRQSFQESELYQKVLKYSLSEAEFDEKFAALPDIDDTNDDDWDWENEDYYFKYITSSFYEIIIRYTIPLIEDED